METETRACWRDDCTEKRTRRGMCDTHNIQWIADHPPRTTRLRGRAEEERFWFYVDQKEVAECWVWLGALDIGGYGVFNLNEQNGGGQVKAHRYAYRTMRGEIPEKIDGKNAELDHRCRIRPCVNPWHLQVVTQRGNTLIGVGFAAENAKKTHCPNGHPYAGDNLMITSEVARVCRKCTNQRNADRQATDEFLEKRREKYEPSTGVRGKGAYQKQRTHCANGHPYEGGNLIIERRKKSNGGIQEVRRCRTCVRAKARKK